MDRWLRISFGLWVALGLVACGDGSGDDGTESGSESSSGETSPATTDDPSAGPTMSSGGSETDSATGTEGESEATGSDSESESESDSDSETGPAPTCVDSPVYRVGAGIADVTGPAAELVMMGYSQPEQVAEGISMRLWSRAFTIEDPCGAGQMAFVSVDVGQVFQGVHLEVLQRLQDHFGPGVYTRDNVILSATHTHSSLAGYSHYTMYNLAAGGYDPQNFEAVVSGIVNSIIVAHESMGPALIRRNRGHLQDANYNRSPQPYALNPADERETHEGEHQRDTNTRMTVLRFERLASDEPFPVDPVGQPFGAVVWFSSHGTSISGENLLVHGDHKGYASYLFERAMGVETYAGDVGFVAAFAQSDSGDVTPNQVTVGEPQNTVARPCDNNPDPLCDDIRNAEVHGEQQYNFAHALFDQASELVTGTIGGRTAFIDMESVEVDGAYTSDGQNHETCVSAIGWSIAAGAEDGRAVEFIGEGVTLPDFVVLPGDANCHAEKAILLPSGRMVPYPWAPTVLPVQVVKLGALAIAAGPFEITTLAGSRLRSSVATELAATGVDEVVIAGLSNAYSSYVTTRQEYAAQHYEGAFTMFGPWTLAAYRQEFAKVARAIAEGGSVDDTGTPLDLSDDQLLQVPGNVGDSPCANPVIELCLGQDFGDVALAPDPQYTAGEQVVVRFLGAHLRNDLRTGEGYLQVERLSQDMQWEVVAHDWDPQTRLRWLRTNGALSPSSEIEVQWAIPADSQPGTYRIRIDAAAKNTFTQDVFPISGETPTFDVL